MLSRTWMVVLWTLLAVRTVSVFLFWATVGSVGMLCCGAVLGILGALEWWVLGTRWCWGLWDWLNEWARVKSGNYGGALY